MLSEDQKRILGYFIEEAKDHLNTIEQGLLNLQTTIEDTEMVNEVFRAAHSVKGGAAMLGLNSIRRTSHRLEDFFKLMKESPPQVDRELESMLLRISDGLQEQLDQLQSPYGLSDDQAEDFLSDLEPVFAEAEIHLQTLLEQSPSVAKVPAAVVSKPASTEARVSHPETSALQLVFQSDVPALLRDMLATFKKQESESSRQELSQICQRLRSLGEQFELTQWSELIGLTIGAVGNTEQTFRSLAPVIIKDLKQAQDLVLSGDAEQITPSEALLALVPSDPESDDSALDALLAEALDDNATDEVDLADLFAAAESEEAVNEGDADGSWLDEVSQPEMGDTADLEAAFDSLTSEVMRATSTSADERPVGVEVGTAELNSLADLFEGDLKELDAAWEEEELSDLPSDEEIGAESGADLESDLADLLETSETDSALESTADDDMLRLFGESFDQTPVATETAATPELGGEPNLTTSLFDSDDLDGDGLEPSTEISPEIDDLEKVDDFFALEANGPQNAQPSTAVEADAIDDFFDAVSEPMTTAAERDSSPVEAANSAASNLEQDMEAAAITAPGDQAQPSPSDSSDPVSDLIPGETEETNLDALFDVAEVAAGSPQSEAVTANLEVLLDDFPIVESDAPFREDATGEEISDEQIMFDNLSVPLAEEDEEVTETDSASRVDNLDFGDLDEDKAELSPDLNQDLWGEDGQFNDVGDQAPEVNLDVANIEVSPIDSEIEGIESIVSGAASHDEETTAYADQPASKVGAESVDPSDFDDLESLLDEPIPDSSPPSDWLTAESGEGELEDLEALLDEGPGIEAAAEEITGADSDRGDELDEFSDLEKLLEDTDQLGGSSPTLSTRRRSSAQPARRTPRRTPVVTDQTMRVSVSHLDILSNLVGELVVNRNSLEQDQERLRQFLDNLLAQVQQLNDVGQRMRDLYERSLLESSLISSRQAMVASGPGNGSNDHATGATFDALEMDRFTGFHTLSQEMIELIVRVREAASDIEFTIDSSDQITRQFRQVTTQLQEGLNKARMVPFGQTADRLPRAVRDISLKCGKEARLVVDGRDTLIDKMILERLYDPVTHLVNNAITHGIEPPEERQSSGKSREGTITIRAFYQGNQTVIYIADDGGGINPDVVKAKALKKGLITPAEAEEMSDVEVYDLLFLPGFSTRDQADDFSGRGVGMDVVRTALADIRGAITIESTLGKGTSFTIRLPLTLSITKALSCVNNQARIAFPMDGVEDMFDAPKERIQTNEQGVSCILWRDTLLPFRPLGDLLLFNRSLGRGRVYGGTSDDNVVSIVVLRSASTFIGLQVDQVIGEQEIVIKQLEGPVPKPTGIAGATVMGDGRVMPIADVLELIDLSTGRVRREPVQSLWGQAGEEDTAPAVDREEPTVLIVDDSITVRELLSMSFSKVGYRVEQARDGQEAWEKLRSGLPCDLVFCDIEMPRMDGLELLSRLQKDEQLSRIPIAMLTSRGAGRHRQMAVDLGASGYFTKPYLEEMLLDAAQRMLNGENMIRAGTEAQTQEV